MEKELPYQTLGKVVSIQQFGALVELVDTNEVGILHISKLSERFISDVQKFLSPGEIIRVNVVNTTNNRIELSIIDIPHYRNVDTSGAIEFEILARELPKWIIEARTRNNRK